MKRLLLLITGLLLLFSVEGQILRYSNYTTPTPPEEVSSLLTGLVSVWKLDEESGTSIADAKGSNTGTLSGATVNQTGKIGKAVLFNDTDEIINCGADASVVLRDSLSISLWVSAAASQPTYGRYAGRQDVIFPYIHPTTGISGVSAPAVDGTLGGADLRDDGWHQLVITFSVTSDSIKYYIDGVYTGYQAKAIALADQAAVPFTIGNRVAGDRYFNGLIDNVCLWNVELTSAQVADLYTKENAGTVYPWD